MSVQEAKPKRVHAVYDSEELYTERQRWTRSSTSSRVRETRTRSLKASDRLSYSSSSSLSSADSITTAREVMTRKDSMKKRQEAERRHLLPSASARHDAPARIVKGHAPFWVGSEGETRRRFAVPVGLLGHPRILELLVEAKEEYGYTHEGAIVVPCSAERFQMAVDAARASERHRHQHRFRLLHFAGCFRPSHVVS